MLSKGSFEDFLYILIGIVWVAFSLYKGNKNRKKASPLKQNVKKKKSFFETFLDEVTEQNQQQVETPYADVPVSDTTPFPTESREQEKIFSYDDVYEEGNYKEAETILATEEHLTEKSAEIKAQVTERKKVKFDLRKAVIYSEILQPKYF